jgi:hypothetical protein
MHVISFDSFRRCSRAPDRELVVGWVKRDVDPIYVGFAYLNAPQKFGVEVKLANPTRLVGDRRLNPTYDLAFRTTKWIPSLRYSGFLTYNLLLRN